MRGGSVRRLHVGHSAVTVRFDRIVAGLLAAGVLACAAAAVMLRPAPLPAADAARWIGLAQRSDAENAVLHRSWDIDTIDAGGDRVPFTAGIPPLRRGERFAVTGWAVDPGLREPAGGVEFRVDGGAWRPARYPLPRPDVAAALNMPGASGSGYRAEVSTGALAPGRHELEFATTGGHRRLPMMPVLTFEITVR